MVHNDNYNNITIIVYAIAFMVEQCVIFVNSISDCMIHVCLRSRLDYNVELWIGIVVIWFIIANLKTLSLESSTIDNK